jgi:hypothetical protein
MLIPHRPLHLDPVSVGAMSAAALYGVGESSRYVPDSIGRPATPLIAGFKASGAAGGRHLPIYPSTTRTKVVSESLRALVAPCALGNWGGFFA